MATVTRMLRSETGLTLTEVFVVMIIGTMIMAGLVGFYLASQGLWLDASTQAITQREASLVAEAVRDYVRQSGAAIATPSPDGLHQQLALLKTSKPGEVPYYYFWWDPADSLIHSGATVGGTGTGPMIVSRADRFQVTSTTNGVRMDLRLWTATGSTVEIGTYAVFQN